MKKNISLLNLSISMTEARKLVIGFFKFHGDDMSKLELIVTDNRETTNSLETIRFTQFGAIQRMANLPMDRGNVYLFPDGKNLEDMIDNPIEFGKFCDLVVVDNYIKTNQ